MNATQYNSGENPLGIYISTSQHLLTLPFDENTVLLKIQWYFLSKRTSKLVYKVTQNDTTAGNFGEKGLIYVTVTEDMYNPKVDRIDLGVCDYFEPESSNSVPTERYVELNRDNLIMGTNNKLTISLYHNGELDTSTKITWNVTKPNGFEDMVSVQHNDNNECTIEVAHVMI